MPARALIRSTCTALALAAALSACAPLEPWVKPYERENLADPIMAFDRYPSRPPTSTTCTRRARSARGDGECGWRVRV